MPRNVRGVLRWIVVGRPNGYRAEVRRRTGCFEWLDRPRNATPEGYAAPSEPSPDARIALVHAAEVPPGTVVEVVSDGKPLAVANVDGQFYVVDATCPHAGGPLGDGSLDGCVLTCPWHGWSYDLATGRSLVDASVTLTSYPVEVVNGVVVLAAPAA